MIYYFKLAPISDVGVFATLDTDSGVMTVAQTNNSRPLQTWDNVFSPNSGTLTDWAMANGALPIVQCVDLAEATGNVTPVQEHHGSDDTQGVNIPSDELSTVDVDVSTPATVATPADVKDGSGSTDNGASDNGESADTSAATA